jgi:hypothetical protein
MEKTMRIHFPEATRPEIKDEPRWKHDRTCCKFLGSVYINQHYDVYVCGSGILSRASILARYGHDGPEYASWDMATLQQMMLDNFKASIYGTGEITYEITPTTKAMLYVMMDKIARDA